MQLPPNALRLWYELQLNRITVCRDVSVAVLKSVVVMWHRANAKLNYKLPALLRPLSRPHCALNTLNGRHSAAINAME